MENTGNSVSGLPKVVHDNASKTVEGSVRGALNTVSSMGIGEIDMNKFYDSLNKKQ